MNKTYFCTIMLPSGEWVDVVYESNHRKGSLAHNLDIADAALSKGINIYKCKCNTAQDAYIMNKKNKDEQCFGEMNRVIDFREKGTR